MDFHVVCCTLLLLTCTGVCSGQELILPERINKALGETVVITPISIPGPTYDFVRWRFNAGSIIALLPGGTITEPSYIDRINLDSTTLALELRNLTKNDTGNYSLTIETSAKHFTAVTPLQVFVPVSNVTIVADRTELVEFNSTVSLVCSASGTLLSFIWLNGSSEVTAGERVQLTDGNSSLTITTVIRGDTGPYQCEASNIINKVLSPPLSLTIYYGPDNVTVKVYPVGPFYSSGYNLTLTCSAESSPAAEFQWAVNGSELGEMGQELRLSNIQSSQSGNYTCIAHNKQSLRFSTSKPISITVLEAIHGAALTGPTDTLIEGVSSVALTCEASGDIYSIEWMKDDQKLSASDTITFSNDSRSVMISPVRRTDNGVYQCNLHNPISSDTATYRMTVNFGPDNVIVNGPSEVQVGESDTLSCHAESTPTPSYKWIFNGTLTGVNTDKFTLKEVNLTHAGTYTCMASNPVTGRDASGSHVLVVKENVIAGGGGETLSAGAIAGIVIGVLLGVAGIAGLVFYFMKVNKMPRGNKQKGAAPNGGQHELHYADVSHLRYEQRQQGIPTVPKAQAPSQHNKTATSNPATQTIYSDVRNL